MLLRWTRQSARYAVCGVFCFRTPPAVAPQDAAEWPRAAPPVPAERLLLLRWKRESATYVVYCILLQRATCGCSAGHSGVAKGCSAGSGGASPVASLEAAGRFICCIWCILRRLRLLHRTQGCSAGSVGASLVDPLEAAERYICCIWCTLLQNAAGGCSAGHSGVAKGCSAGSGGASPVAPLEAAERYICCIWYILL